jgi:CDP-paratose 2-epimerase
MEQSKLKRFSNESSILILGGAGFIGCNWASWLLQHSAAHVHVFDNLSRSGTRHNLEWLKSIERGSGRLEVTIADIRDAHAVERAVQYATEIYHFAAQTAVTTSIEDPELDFEVNLRGTLNVLEAARKSGGSPFLLFTSTNKVYGDLDSKDLYIAESRYRSRAPHGVNETMAIDLHTPYGCSKGAADQYVRDYARIFGLHTIVFRMSCIAGPHQLGNEDQGWIAHFLYSALQDNLINIYGDGKQVRDVLCVHDLVRAFCAARELGQNFGGTIYNIGGGPENAISLIELISLIEQLTNRKTRLNFSDFRRGDQLYYVTDYGSFSHDTGWKPSMGVQCTLNLICDFWNRNQACLLSRES